MPQEYIYSVSQDTVGRYFEWTPGQATATTGDVPVNVDIEEIERIARDQELEARRRSSKYVILTAKHLGRAKKHWIKSDVGDIRYLKWASTALYNLQDKLMEAGLRGDALRNWMTKIVQADNRATISTAGIGATTARRKSIKTLLPVLRSEVANDRDLMSIGSTYSLPRRLTVFIRDTDEYIPVHSLSDGSYYQDTATLDWFSSEQALQRYYRSMEREGHDRYIHDYSTDPMRHLTFMRMADEPSTVNPKGEDITPYLGVELEVLVREPRLGMAKKVLEDLKIEKKNFAIIKRDSSVCHNDAEGFEIVTAPATLKVHQMAWDKFFDNSCRLLKGWSAKNCGIHVHVAKKAFVTNLHLSKFSSFFGLPVNKGFIENIAGRSDNRYSTKLYKKVGQTSSYMHDSNRYQAVNLCKRTTVEVRIFQSNVAKLGFLKNVEFVHAVWLYTRHCSIQEKEGTGGLHFKDFVAWLNEPGRNKQYSFLHKWAVRQKYIAEKPIADKYKQPQHREELIECA
jgi:hypothetical protein